MIMTLIAMALFIASLGLIGRLGGLNGSGSHPHQIVEDTTPEISPETFVYFPWRTTIESLPVSVNGPMELGYDTEYTLTVTEVMNRASGELDLQVHAQHQTDDGRQTTHLGLVRLCHSGNQWIEWLEGDAPETFDQCNKRAQQVCEAAGNTH
jgi:hypothetical protein